MKVRLTQQVKLSNDSFPHSWYKEYTNLVIPCKGDYLEDPLWKDPGEYEVTGITINYYEDFCYVGLKPYDYEIPEEQKAEYTKMAKLHGWNPSWDVQ